MVVTQNLGWSDDLKMEPFLRTVTKPVFLIIVRLTRSSLYINKKATLAF